MVTNTNFALSKANACPTQNLDPNEKGIKANGCLLVLTILSANHSSLNSCTFVPHNLGSWWMASLGKYMFVPFGIYRSPTVMSITACLFCSRTSRNKRRVSFKIIVNYTPSNHTINNQVHYKTWVEKKLQKVTKRFKVTIFNLLKTSKSSGWSSCTHTSTTSLWTRSCQVVPSCMGCQQRHGPCEKNCCCVMSNQEGLTIIYQWLHSKINLSTLDSNFLWCCNEHETQQVTSICQEFYYSYKFVP